MIVALIDGDIFVYRAALGNQTTTDWGEDKTTEVDLQAALQDAEELVHEVAETLIADRTIVCLSHTENFRKAIYPPYKAKRNGKSKPLAWRPIREMLKSKFEVKIKETLEADDVLGILMTHPKLVPGKKVIASIDKDLLQIPGRHFNPNTKDKRVVKEIDGEWLFFKQTLMGDPVDEYPGVPGIGPKKAQDIIQEAVNANAHLCGTLTACVWEDIVATYEKAGLTAGDALVQARVARILRHTDYDFKTKRPILWSP